MTLNIGAVTPSEARLVTDRLLSSRGKEWDPLANKNVVLFAGDAVAALGYSGTAFISRKGDSERLPTDQWIVEACSGERIQRAFNGEPSTRLSYGSPTKPVPGLAAVLEQLRSCLSVAFSDGSVDRPLRDEPFVVLVVGWRADSLPPVVCRVFRRSPQEAFEVQWAPSGTTKRTFFVIEPSSNAQHADIPALQSELESCSSTDDFENALTAAVRRASRALPGYIGANVMSIHLPHPDEQRVRIRYLPIGATTMPLHNKQFPVAYTPWIVAPGLLQPPQRAIGSRTARVGHWRVEMVAPPSGGTFFSETQKRKRP